MTTVEALIIRSLIGRSSFDKVRTFEALKLNPHLLTRPESKRETVAAVVHFREYVTLCQFIELGCRCVVCGAVVTAADKVVISRTDIVPRIQIICRENYAAHHSADSVMHFGCSHASKKSAKMELTRELTAMKLQLNIEYGQYLLKQSEQLRKIVGDDAVYDIITAGNIKAVVLRPDPAPSSSVSGPDVSAIVQRRDDYQPRERYFGRDDSVAAAAYLRINVILTSACLVVLILQVVLTIVL